jgi:K+-transporting ATPase A subunit
MSELNYIILNDLLIVLASKKITHILPHTHLAISECFYHGLTQVMNFAFYSSTAAAH